MAVRNFDAPDETRQTGRGSVDVVKLDSATVARINSPAGWRWSTDVKPIVGTDRCEAHHLGYLISGRITIETREGETFEIGPGEAYEIAPGHDAWVMGDESVIGLEFQNRTAETFART